MINAKKYAISDKSNTPKAEELVASAIITKINKTCADIMHTLSANSPSTKCNTNIATDINVANTPKAIAVAARPVQGPSRHISLIPPKPVRLHMEIVAYAKVFSNFVVVTISSCLSDVVAGVVVGVSACAVKTTHALSTHVYKMQTIVPTGTVSTSEIHVIQLN